MKSSSFNRRALAANILIWLLFIASNYSASLVEAARAGREVDLIHRAINFIISFGPWMLMTPVFYLYLQWRQRRNASAWVGCLQIFLFWAPLVILFEVSSILFAGEGAGGFWQTLAKLPVYYWMFYAMLFCATLGICMALLYAKHAAELNRATVIARQENTELALQLSELRIQSLLTQLEPHFLFNALNAIASLVRITDKSAALTAIQRLSDLLRYTLQASRHKLVRFDDELAFVTDYLALQSLRFGEKLSVNIADSRQRFDQECPPFVLQIFVENAIKHGMEASGSHIQLEIYIDETSQGLRLQVNNTHQHDETIHTSLGIGLSNLQARLNILYRHPVELETRHDNNLHSVTVILPQNAKVTI